jgi:prevent-host-death family protein
MGLAFPGLGAATHRPQFHAPSHKGEADHCATRKYVQHCTISRMRTISVSDARASLPELLDRVGEGEEITITRHGVPVAVVVRPDALRARRATEVFEEADSLRVTLDRARQMLVDEAPTLDASAMKEHLSELRASRRAR